MNTIEIPELTYTWEIQALERTDTEEIQGLITRVFFLYKGIDENEIEGEYSNYLHLNLPSSTPIPFVDLTEETVIDWIENFFAKEENLTFLLDIKYVIYEQILRKKNNTLVLSKENFPWLID